MRQLVDSMLALGLTYKLPKQGNGNLSLAAAEAAASAGLLMEPPLFDLLQYEARGPPGSSCNGQDCATFGLPKTLAHQLLLFAVICISAFLGQVALQMKHPQER